MSDQDLNELLDAHSKSTATVADQQPAAAPSVTPQVVPVADPYQELLSGITNAEGSQKYANVSQALAGASHANQHISTIEAENSVFKEDMTVKDTKIAMLEKQLEALQTAPEVPTSQPEGLQAKDMDSVIEQKLIEREEAKQKLSIQETQAANKQLFADAVMSQYGDSSKTTLTEAMNKRGWDAAKLQRRALEDPQETLELLGLNVRIPKKDLGVGNSMYMQPNTSPTTPDGRLEGESNGDMYKRLEQHIRNQNGLK